MRSCFGTASYFSQRGTGSVLAIICYSASPCKELTDIRDFSKPHLGAFPAAPETGLCGGSAACAAAPRPSNPLRTSTHPRVDIISMIDTLAANFELIVFREKRYIVLLLGKN
jgi:hypothetical protein